MAASGAGLCSDSDTAPQCRWIMTQSKLQKQPKSFSPKRNGIFFNDQQSLQQFFIQVLKTAILFKMICAPPDP